MQKDENFIEFSSFSGNLELKKFRRTFTMQDESAKIIAQLTETNHQLTEKLDMFAKEIARLNEQVAYLTKKLYGKSSEKGLSTNGQMSLFDNNEETSDDDDDLPN